MYLFSSLLTLGAVANVAFGLAFPLEQRDDRARSVYTMANDQDGEYLLALPIKPDGKLGSPVKTLTGGRGQRATTKTGLAGPDSLFSQQAIVVSEDYLFVVNSGSDTISMFRIPHDDPTHPVLVDAKNSMGDFPLSVAYSSKLKTTCALNGGAANTVACFHTTHDGLQSLHDARSLSRWFTQPTPPVFVADTASHILFNPSSSFLLVIIKGDPAAVPITLGTFLVYRVGDDGTIAHEPVVSRVAGNIVSFGAAFVSDTEFVVSDPAFGSALLVIGSDGTITEKTHTVIAGQIAVCWATYAQRFGSVYITDAAKANISVIDASSGALTGQVNYPVDLKGGVDSSVDRTYLYLLTTAASVATFKLPGLELLQNVDVSLGGSKLIFEGLAVYPS